MKYAHTNGPPPQVMRFAAHARSRHRGNAASPDLDEMVAPSIASRDPCPRVAASRRFSSLATSGFGEPDAEPTVGPVCPSFVSTVGARIDPRAAFPPTTTAGFRVAGFLTVTGAAFRPLWTAGQCDFCLPHWSGGAMLARPAYSGVVGRPRERDAEVVGSPRRRAKRPTPAWSVCRERLAADELLAPL